ncbi:hypothetical protein GCM10020221_29830 [Streptomyces thioluteus]|uniref:Uncharacterized protein n=1 Tax=Streptomyces thioluteus TaxID=66431 RepID=A0ABN3X0N0_STRTU
MKIHISEAPKTALSATAANRCRTEVSTSSPSAKPTASWMATATSSRNSSLTIFDTRTDDRAIGMVRKRSMTPLRKSSLTPTPTAMAMLRPVMASRPGTR